MHLGAEVDSAVERNLHPGLHPRMDPRAAADFYGRWVNIAEILIVVVVVVAVVGRRLAGEPLTMKRLVVLPVILCAIGLAGLSKARHPGAADVGLVVVGLAVSLGLGMLRGRSVEVAVRNGVLWYRYRWATVAWWVAAAVARVGLMGVERMTHAGHLMSSSLLVGLAATFLGEAAIVYPRARALGAPFAADRRAI